MILLKKYIRVILFNNSKKDPSSSVDSSRLSNALNSYFKDDISGTGNYDWKSTTKRVFSQFATMFLSVLVHYFDKYSEVEFHQRMNNQYSIKDGYSGKVQKLTGFDYVGDFKKFHASKFKVYVYAFKAQKSLITFDENRMMTTISEIFKAKGWTVSNHEMQGIYWTMKRLKNILYHNYDSIENLDHLK